MLLIALFKKRGGGGGGATAARVAFLLFLRIHVAILADDYHAADYICTRMLTVAVFHKRKRN